MTDDFVNATTNDYGANKIARSPFARALYFNPIAIAEGAAGAPRILAGALESPAAGDVVCLTMQLGDAVDGSGAYLDPGRVNVPGRSYAFSAIVEGAVRIKLSHYSEGGDVSEARVMKNDALVQEWSTSANSPVARSVDVTIERGDLITIQHRSTASDEQGFISQVFVCADQFLIVGF